MTPQDPWRSGGRDRAVDQPEGSAGRSIAPPVVHQALARQGQPLPGRVRADLERRLGQDFSAVRVHTDVVAAASAAAVDAEAYTVGSEIVFAADRFDPGSPAGQRLLRHELAHVSSSTSPTVRPGALVVSRAGDEGERYARQVSSGRVDPGSVPAPCVPSAPPASAQGVLHRQMAGGGITSDDADLAAEREYGDTGAPRAQRCGRPSHCPPGFCDPYRSQQLAEYYRAKNGGWIMAGISAAVDSRVVPLWRDYLNGGSAPRDLTAAFAADFTGSRATRRTTDYLVDEVRRSVSSSRPPVTSTRTVSLASLVPTAIAEINTAGGAHEMNFNIPRDVAGNLAGGIGTDQLSCPAGARPSPFNDERVAQGTVELARTGARSVEVRPHVSYRVIDTIDLCPGDCGTSLEQIATVPLSQFEATGISGDVPFHLDFPAPTVTPFSMTY